jgi:antitoxin component YwqK of YwqJK toxin-antitoxin module
MNGKINYKGNYNEKGKKNGAWEYWFENGSYRETGSYVSGIKHGHWTSYFEKGNFVDSDGDYKKGKQHGTWLYYYETGGLMKSQTFKEGHLSGKSISFYSNNKIQSECNYKIISEKRKGKKQSVAHGNWIFYDKLGNEMSRFSYKNGIKK